MTRIHQQASGKQYELWYRSGIRYLQHAKSAILMFGALALLAASATAQSTTQLNGSITDPSGAAVSGAKITLTDSATGFQRSTTSNSAGLYQFLDVPPGSYHLDANASGFAPYTVAKVTLLVKLPSTVNIQLRVGSATTSVTVEGEAPLVNRTDATLGNVIESDQLSELPIADRNVAYMLSLQPGVSYFGIQTQQQQDTDTRSGAVNGMRSDQSNVTLDGIGVNDQNSGFSFYSVLNVPPDSIDEFRVTTANSNADSGYSSGAQVSLVTKSGTNSFHGSAYEYNRTTFFSANDPFLKESEVQGGQPTARPELIRNVFGVSFGGPIKKNRFFFFANYEGFRDAEATSESRVVPSAALENGFVQYQCADASACAGGQVTDPTSGYSVNVQSGYFALTPTQVTAMDPGNTATGQKGPNAAIVGLLDKYPAANQSGGDSLNTLGYRFASPAKASKNTYIMRGDWNINNSGSETLFLRGQTQNNKQPGPEQFPGQAVQTTLLDDSKGLTVGLTSLINPKLINNFHWGYIRQGGKTGSTVLYPGIYLSGIDNLVPFAKSQRPNSFFVPVNQFTDSLNWTRRNHTLEFGGDFFLIRNNRSSYTEAFSDVQTNPAYIIGGGISYPLGNPNPLNPANNGPVAGGCTPATGVGCYPSVLQTFSSNYDQAITILLGIFSEGDGIYNFNHNGSALPQGSPINRRYAINNYEFYGQDAWRITPRLTVTYGLRWVLEAPPYETNGLQVSPCVEAASGGCSKQNLADWFNSTRQLMNQGQPAINAGELSFILGGPKNNGPGMWNWDHKDFSPRIAIAWAPDTGDGRLSKILGKKDQFTVRAGYSIMYDHFGIPIVNSFDQNGSFGLSSQIGNPAGVSVTVQGAPRFTCLTPGSSGQSCLPVPCAQLSGPTCLFGPAPTGGFPVTPAAGNFAINWGLDQSLKTPYSHVFNFSLQRQLTNRSSLQVAYVGTVARRLPMQVDLAMPANPTDPASGMTYFQAASMLSQYSVANNGANANNLQPIPFFEHMFPPWNTVNSSQLPSGPNGCGTVPNNPTATQAIYGLWNCYLHNETLALSILDLPNSNTPNSKFGPYTFFHDQFSSLYSWRNIGTSDYNALQVSYNVRWGANLQGQFNYTWSKAFDEASAAERIGPYEGTGGTGNDLNGGGIVINAWSPLSLRGLSDFNAFHQINANLVYRLPFGKGQMLAANAGPLLNELIGGWHTSGVVRWTSAFPVTVDNGSGWPTDWNIEGDAEPNGPPPQMATTKNAYVGNTYVGPDMFVHPDLAQAAYRMDYPGESGVRNSVFGDGMFNVDTGVSKDFSLGEQRRLEFSWQAFNAFNSVRYDVRKAQPALSQAQANFGQYTSTITTPRFMQFALRLVF